MNILETAKKYLGQHEIDGEKNNPFILECLESVHLNGCDETTAWCSAFVNFCAIESGLEHTNKGNARSWLDVGDNINLANAQAGDIVIFWRESRSSWKGHVAIFDNVKDGANISHLGGNQSDSVCYQSTHKSRLLGIRRLTKL